MCLSLFLSAIVGTGVLDCPKSKMFSVARFVQVVFYTKVTPKLSLSRTVEDACPYKIC